MREPIRCFEGNAKPYEPFWSFANAAEGAEPEMELYGFISEFSWWEDEITPQKFKDDMNKYGKGGPITIRMNSHGGDVIAASIMNAIIRDYPGRVTVQVDGLAASAATVVAVAGDVLKIQETAYFMIHDPLAVFFMAMFNIDELTRMVESMKAVKEGIVNVYETKTGLSRTRLSKLMSDETWMDAQKAMDLGFVDEIIRGGEPKQIEVPENAAVVNALRKFVNLPASLRAKLEPKAEPVVQAEYSAVVPSDVARLRAEVKLYK